MAAEFIAEKGLLKGLILSLDKGERWIIGRDPEQCDIVLEDPKTSRQALLCTKSDQGYFIENLSETNPVLVNEVTAVSPTLLHPGDLVVIGATEFRFYSEREDIFSSSSESEQEEEVPFEFPVEEMTEKESESHLEGNEPESIEQFAEDELLYEGHEEERDSIFEEEGFGEPIMDLTPDTRFLIKIIAGPNTGAEFALESGKGYLIGTDTSTCDIVFNDLSVSREHAKLEISSNGQVFIEDLGSRNGVVMDRERIIEKQTLHPNAVVAIGTSAFLLIDKEAPAETIVAPLFETPQEEREEQVIITPAADSSAVLAEKKSRLASGTFMLSLFIAALAVLFGIGIVSLLQTKEVETTKYDYAGDVRAIIKDFPAVRYTYNRANQKLFLMGHVSTAVDHSELNYRLRGLNFLKDIEDNVVNDEAVWQDMNILLSKHPDFKGVSMHSPSPGQFVLSGYLQTESQGAALSEYMNLHFNYLNLLDNRVVVEEQVTSEVTSSLIQAGFGAVNVSFSNGDIQFTGYISSAATAEFEEIIEEFKDIPGVRSIKNFVVTVSPEQGVIDLNKRFPGRYRVTGYSKHGEVNINVVINGRILTRGDVLDGMTVTSIQPHTIFLEKDGLKYKIEYNK